MTRCRPGATLLLPSFLSAALFALCCGGDDAESFRDAPVAVDLAGLAAPPQSPPEAEGTADAASAVPEAGVRPEARIELLPGEPRDFYFRLPPRAAFTVDAVQGTGTPVEVILQPADGREAPLGGLAAGGFQALPLSGTRWGVVRLSLTAARHGGGGRAVLLRPAIRSLEPPPPAVGSAPPGTPAAAGRRPNVIVYLVDTLRADRLGAYGCPRPTSPGLDGFAARATMFEEAYAQSSWTRASVASIFTGLGPRFHGANRRGDALTEEVETLAEVFHRAGYRTAGFVTNGNVGPGFGFSQGFGRYEVLGERDAEELHHLSDRVNGRVFPWLARRAADGDPFFLYVHTMDPHSPYAPPPAFRERFAGRTDPPPSAALQEELERISRELDPRFGPEVRSLSPGSMVWMRALARGVVPVVPERLEQLRDLYDAEIAHNDGSFGAFVAELERLGLYDDAVIVFTADHGEEFYEHGGWEHGATLYGEQLRIPLILKLPGQRRGTRRTDPAQHVDLLPTLVEAAGLPPASAPPGNGRSLVAAPPDGGEAPPRPVFSFLDLDGVRLAGVREGRHKLVVRTAPRPGTELFDVAADPAETEDLYARLPTVAGYLRSLLAARRTAGPTHRAPRAAVAPELRRKLEALGYLD